MPNVRSITRGNLPQALQVLLGPAGQSRPADRAQIDGFLRYLETSTVRWEGFRCDDGGRSTAVGLALLVPGRTAIVMAAPPDRPDVVSAHEAALLRYMLARLEPNELHFAQALIPPEDAAQRELFRACGFRDLAPLAYLERNTRYPWVDGPEPRCGTWVGYAADTHDDFARVIAATYGASRDCPELTNLRPIEDVIAGHMASGRFENARWELLRTAEGYAGCMLLSPLATGQAAEVVYMGVVPRFRGHGIGDALLRRALENCRALHVKRLTLAVDNRNEPAKGLYARFAFRVIGRRDALLYRWKTQDPHKVGKPCG